MADVVDDDVLLVLLVLLLLVLLLLVLGATAGIAYLLSINQPFCRFRRPQLCSPKKPSYGASCVCRRLDGGALRNCSTTLCVQRCSPARENIFELTFEQHEPTQATWRQPTPPNFGNCMWCRIVGMATSCITSNKSSRRNFCTSGFSSGRRSFLPATASLRKKRCACAGR